jgi:hypothetical protein
LLGIRTTAGEIDEFGIVARTVENKDRVAGKALAFWARSHPV